MREGWVRGMAKGNGGMRVSGAGAWCARWRRLGMVGCGGVGDEGGGWKVEDRGWWRLCDNYGDGRPRRADGRGLGLLTHSSFKQAAAGWFRRCSTRVKAVSAANPCATVYADTTYTLQCPGDHCLLPAWNGNSRRLRDQAMLFINSDANQYSIGQFPPKAW